MSRAARLVWVMAAVVLCLWSSYASAVDEIPRVDVRPRKVWDDIHPFEVKPYLMSEDFGNEPRYDCALQYYYFIPCPAYSWFWGVYGWEPGDMLGAHFRIGDVGTGGFDPCDPLDCVVLEHIRVLDFAGYGTYYPGLFTIEMGVWCSDMSQNPLLPLWDSGPVETAFGWDYIAVNEGDGIEVYDCFESDPEYPGIIVTMTFIGVEGRYPAVGFDNVGTSVETGCEMHDIGCLPAVYPRACAGGDGAPVRSGYVGNCSFEYWPPRGIPDGKHANRGCLSWYGFSEAAWRIYLHCWGPCMSPAATPPTSWGGIKNLYR
ncbi:MAG: hypothetical protein ABIJ00_03205 [Candidatus Eisenbacteria bacterium]